MKVKNFDIGKELRSLSNLIMRFVDNKLNKRNIESVTGTNGWIISYIAENADRNIYQRDLEKKFGVTRSTVSNVVNLMVKKGLIEKRSVPRDARLKKLVLTPKARAISQMMQRDMEIFESALTKDFSREELSQLYFYIRRMKQNMQ